MDSITRKAKIIEAIIRTEDEEILSSLESILNMAIPVESFDAEAWLAETDKYILQTDISKNDNAAPLREFDFWDDEQPWKK